MSRDELFEYLAWMLGNGIIDINEYNELLQKSLPFAE